MVHRAKASHIGSALSCADILAAVYGDLLQPEDVFILSKGHATVALYAALYHTGADIDLNSYGQNGSPLMHHASHRVPGVPLSTGSLGHGLPFGTGIAYNRKRRGKAGRVFVLLSDGEMQEGSNWEAIQFAAHHKLSNLVAIIDYNNLQSLTRVQDTLAVEPLETKLKAFQWQAESAYGHDIKEFCGVVRKHAGTAPLGIIAYTTKGKGVSFMENKVEWHYKYPDETQLEQALREVQNA